MDGWAAVFALSSEIPDVGALLDLGVRSVAAASAMINSSNSERVVYAIFDWVSWVMSDTAGIRFCDDNDNVWSESSCVLDLVPVAIHLYNENEYL